MAVKSVTRERRESEENKQDKTEVIGEAEADGGGIQT